MCWRALRARAVAAQGSFDLAGGDLLSGRTSPIGSCSFTNIGFRSWRTALQAQLPVGHIALPRLRFERIEIVRRHLTTCRCYRSNSSIRLSTRSGMPSARSRARRKAEADALSVIAVTLITAIDSGRVSVVAFEQVVHAASRDPENPSCACLVSTDRCQGPENQFGLYLF
jgi:hypothetical protein